MAEFVGLDRADGSKVQQFLPRTRKPIIRVHVPGGQNGKAYACGKGAGVSRAAHLQRDAAIVVVIQHENGAEVAHVDRPVLQRLQLPNFCRQNTIQQDSDRKCATKNARKHGADSKPILEPALWSPPRAHRWPRAAPASNRKSRSLGHNRSNSEAQCRRTPSDSPVWTEPPAPISPAFPSLKFASRKKRTDRRGWRRYAQRMGLGNGSRCLRQRSSHRPHPERAPAS